jgi:hypothetical protein
MRNRSFILVCLIAIQLIVVGQMPLAGQAKAWTPPRTPEGQPDLQGIWTNATVTPLERPSDLAGKPVFTDEEAAEYAKQTVQANNADRRDVPPEVDVARAYNQLWYDRGTKVVSTKQTSLIVDPPDGRIPALTAQAQKRAADLAEMRRLHPADGPENRSLNERCIKWGTAGPPMIPGPYNNNYQIVQTPDAIVIRIEMIHDVRIIPLDGRPHVGQNIRELMGDSRGHWEGNTLVVDTTNFSDQTDFRNAGRNMHLTERFTRVDPDTILYEFTVDDPTTFTRPWSGAIPMTKTNGPIFEYACHEGNYGMEGILSGARAKEKQRAGSE